MYQIILLNNEWLLSAIRCIIHDGLDDLRLEISEVKEEQSIYSEEENELCQVCLNCPVISSEDTYMLWNSTKSVYQGKRGLSIKYLEEIFTRIKLLVPLKVNKEESRANLYLIPSLVEAGEPPAWSFKNMDPNKITLCDSWIIHGGLNAGMDLMRNITSQILRELLLYLEGSSTASNVDDVEWCTPYGDRYFEDTGGRNRCVLHEVCSWRNSLLIKIELEGANNVCGREGRSVIEILVYFGDKRNEHTISSGSLKNGEKRLTISMIKDEKNENIPKYVETSTFL